MLYLYIVYIIIVAYTLCVNNDNLEAQKSILETDNSPEISLGSKLSLIVVKTLFSLTFSIISVNKGVTKSLNLFISTAFGMVIGIFLSSVKLIYFCVLPASTVFL